MILNDLIEYLNLSLNSKDSDRLNYIKQFQQIVWNDESIQDETLNNILTDIAYILDFYEPSTILREQDTNYYGEERLEKELKYAIQILKPYGENMLLE